MAWIHSMAESTWTWLITVVSAVIAWGVRTELIGRPNASDIKHLRDDLHQEIQQLRADTKQDLAYIRSRCDYLVGVARPDRHNHDRQ